MKKVLIGMGIVAVILAAAFLYMNNRNRTLSPPGSAKLNNGKLAIELTYSRPSVKGRIVFGTEAEEALQPYGTYWRLGANESTEITFNTDILFDGKHVSHGTYRMYAIPGKKYFEVGLNTKLGEWGYFEPDYGLDVLIVQIPVIENGLTEQHTISLSAQGDNGIDVVIEFEKVKLVIPVIPQ
ncbi:MAG: hypothetical protein ACI93L_003104 [Cyclobacteriaceae bacterium]|jgi:hypothetical protein